MDDPTKATADAGDDPTHADTDTEAILARLTAARDVLHAYRRRAIGSHAEHDAFRAVFRDVRRLVDERDERERLRDLVRHQRGPLYDVDLLTADEYAALVADHGAVARLESYDALRRRVEMTERALTTALALLAVIKAEETRRGET